ncbi:MAG TPA: prepilin peptidase, partial [Candidatus Nanoarchaeia archaeon]|nr:prepilin peptidase [Candidatus Nanoarchaeia archaeon]
MVVDILLIILVLVALLVAAITDLRSREVPDWVSYMLIAGALLIRLWYAFTSGFWSYFFFGLAGLGVGVLLGLGLFFSKQWGGGDAKLLMGFGVVFATNPFWYTSNVPFYVAFLFNMIVVGALYGLIASVLLGLVHYHDVARAMADLGKKKWLRFAKIVSLIVAVGIYLFVVMADIVAGWMLLVIASIIVVYP